MKKLLFLMTQALVISSQAQAAQWIQINETNFNQYLTPQKPSLLVGKESQFQLEKKITLSNGVQKNKFIQYYKGIPIYASLMTSTGEHNDAWFGTYLSGIEHDLPSITPAISASDALALAKAKSALTTSAVHEQVKLYVMMDKNTHKAQLVYVVSFVSYGKKPQRPYFVINALTQEIMHQWDGLTTREGTGPGGNQKTGQYYYGRDYSAFDVSDACEMKTDNVETYNLDGKKSGEVLFKFTCPENKFKEINGAYSPINDAHYFGSVVFDMYTKWFKIKPIKTKLKLRLHYGQKFENAFWDGQQMTFGDGAERMYPLTSLDVVAHEVSHGVTEQNSNLEYKNQSGGMNEAFSDMAGEITKFYMQQQVGKENDWLVGANIIKGSAGVALRYLANPSKDGHSIEHARDYDDSMDVHHSSGVYNKAFYTLATKPNWGVKKAFEIFLIANQTYWTANSTFDSGACGVAKAATDLGYEVNDVVSSFNEVGVNANCSAPTPTPTPTPKEIELKNGQIVSPLAIKANEEYKYFIKVPVGRMNATAYKYLIIRLFNDKRNGGDFGELFVRYDIDNLAKNTSHPEAAYKDEVFYIQSPQAGFYHLLIKGKKDGVVSLQAYFGN